MTSEALDPTGNLAAVGGGDNRSGAVADDRRFFRFLLLAVALHALLVVRINTGEPRRLGAEGGADDAISVSLITEQDLQGRATVADTAAGRPAPPPAPQTEQATPPPQPAPPVEQTQPAEPPAPAQTSPPPPTAAAEQPPAETPAPPSALRPTLPDVTPDGETNERPEPAPEKTETSKPAETPNKATELNSDTAKLLELPDPTKIKKPAENPTEAKPKTPEASKPAPKKTETAKLDLTPPSVFQAPAGGGGAGMQRPAGITRSGENDDFARGVIRALQTTMPQLRNTFGRVTVRIDLDMKGNLVRTTVLRPSNVAGLDQSVVFATKQSSFPFPPHNAVPADLVFFVTYIYR